MRNPGKPRRKLVAERNIPALGFAVATVSDDPGHQRWLCLWQGVMNILMREEPRAYQRVLLALEKHHLITLSISSSDDNFRGQPLPYGSITARVPTESVSRGARTFVEDPEPTRLRGRTRQKIPPMLVLCEVLIAREKERLAPQKTGLRGDRSLTERALALVARKLGCEVEHCRKLMKIARRQMSPENRALFKRPITLSK